MRGGGAITAVYGPAGFDPATGGTAVTPASSPLVLGGLVPGTAYQFYVRQACGGTAGSSALAGPVNFSTVPANDDPCAATVLPVNPTACTLLSATNAAATVTTNPSVSAGACTGANISPRDVWFSFTTAATGPTSTAVRIAVAGASASIVQGLRAASCAGPFVSLRCVGSQSNVAAPVLDLTALTPGTQYWVRVHTFQFSDPLGPFSICVTATTVSATAAAADSEALQVYPNPSAGGRLTLRRSQPMAGELVLFDALGQAVRRETLRPATEHTLATAGLAPGLYTLRVVADGQVLTRRVVLE